MTNEEANPGRDDVAEGWPDEGGNAELAQFARGFARSIPQLSPKAIGRVHERMRGVGVSPAESLKEGSCRVSSSEKGDTCLPAGRFNFLEKSPKSRKSPFADGPWAGVLAGLSAAAAILLAIGLWYAVATCRPATPEPPVATQTPVQDTFTVAFTGLPGPKSPERPLVNLGEVESLVSPIR